MKGVYGITFSLLYYQLNWLMETDYKNFLYTGAAIFELSLMTKFHPVLLFKNNDFNPNEIFIPMRFKTLLFHFVKNKKSIMDYCDPNQNLLEGLDKICDELGWIKYSECLHSLNDFYNYEPYSNFFECYLAKSIIKLKLNGDVIFDDTRLRKKIPIVEVFNDSIAYPDKELFKKFPGIPEEKPYSSMERFIKGVFQTELMCGKDFQNTIKFIVKYQNMLIKSTETIDNYLERNNFDKFVSSDEIIAEQKKRKVF
ncbi:MAG: hypothetical protein MJB14_13100 [Spirochaetes bacterium]|nr:hypothetical protein [Spirochaetota bacterium]